ncbi:MAG: phage terminase large subunit [Myxococcota bacterium]|nr:phage terminase large subunit [Myxococcota bacterium]
MSDTDPGPVEWLARLIESESAGTKETNKAPDPSATAATRTKETNKAPAVDLTGINAADLAALERQLVANVCRHDLGAFFRAAWHVLEPTTPLVWSWALEAVCGHLQALTEDWASRQLKTSFVQRMRDLLVTMPPGTAKSRALVMLLPWAWLRWPSLRAICLSANPRVALRDSMYSRDVIASPWYQSTFAPAWQVRQDSDAKGLYSNTVGGFRSAMGFDARIVGERADLVIVDDPHDPEEAESDVQREHVHDRWESSIGNRVNDLGSSIRVGIAQRTHEDDWSARRVAEGWTHVDLPMLFESERACVTPLGHVDQRTTEGERLDSVRFPDTVIAAERRRVGERRWATLYQGRPSPRAGSIVQTSWLRFHRAPGKPDNACTRPSGCWTGPAVETPTTFDAVCIAADLAFGKATTSGDYNVVLVVGKRGADFFVLDVWRARADFPEVQRRFRAFAARFPLSRKVVEQAAAGASLVASLQAEISGLVGLPPHGSKEQRLQNVLAFFEAANVHVDENWPGVADAVAELTMFPNARHDDFLDALTLALSQLATSDKDRRATLRRWVALAGRHRGAALEREVDRQLGVGIATESPPAAERPMPQTAEQWRSYAAEMRAR